MRISDWSSDVCSSDLNLRQQVTLEDAQRVVRCIGVTRQLLHGQRIRFEQRRMWVLALQKAHQQLVEVPAVEDALTAEQQRRAGGPRAPPTAALPRGAPPPPAPGEHLRNHTQLPLRNARTARPHNAPPHAPRVWP